MNLKLKIMASDSNIIEDIQSLNIDTVDGKMGIFPNMAPFITTIKPNSEFFYNKDKQKVSGTINGGIVLVSKEECKIITESIVLNS